MTTSSAVPFDASSPRVLMAPMNFADQPMSLVRALRRRGVYAHHLQYTASGEHALGYALDRLVLLRSGDFAAQFAALRDALEEGFDIFHFWQRSLLFNNDLDGLTGLDLPLIKAHGPRIFHRFTGFDLRLPSRDRALNPHSPFNHGFDGPFDERSQRRYLDMLRHYVDLFLVQDPEMGQFMPEARILPRGLQLEQWPYVGVQPNPRPLVVHAPSNAEVKGSRFVIRALEALRHAGLDFDFKLLERVPHAEAREWYKRADIIVDQILIGATGVLTLEAWALGKPCVTYLREDLFQDFYQTRELPVANATPDTIEDTLRRLIGDYEWRAELARRGRDTAERFHDIEVVADTYLEICRAALADRAPARREVEDIEFFAARLVPPKPAAQPTAAQLAPGRWPPVDWATRQGLPPPQAWDVTKMNIGGRLEQASFNAWLKVFRWVLGVEEAWLAGTERGASSPVARLWVAQVVLFRAILRAQVGLLRVLALAKRACQRLLPGA